VERERWGGVCGEGMVGWGAKKGEAEKEIVDEYLLRGKGKLTEEWYGGAGEGIDQIVMREGKLSGDAT